MGRLNGKTAVVLGLQPMHRISLASGIVSG
jgi:hypothetical protein